MKDCICETCGAAFREKDKRPGRFCCRACYRVSVDESHTEVCEGCGKTFTTPFALHRRYCTQKCYCDHAKGADHSCWQDDAPTAKCKHCGKQYRITPSHEGKQFCSVPCWRAYQRAHLANPETPCVHCGKLFFPERGGDHRCCSVDCQKAHWRSDRSPMWKGGKYTTADTGTKHINTGKNYPGGGPVYRLEHRLLLAEFIGRPLYDSEKVWHINRDHGDNRIENLYVFATQGDMSTMINRGAYPQVSNVAHLRDAV